MRRRPDSRLTIRSLFAVLATFSTAAALTPRAFAEERPSPTTTILFAPRDSAERKLQGMYRPERNSNALVMIASLGNGLFTVTNGISWEGVGYYEAGAFRGVLRAPTGPNAPLAERSYGDLHFTVGADGSIQAQVAIDSAKSAGSDTWTRIGEFGDPTRPAGPPGSTAASGDSLPAFGAYVYVEELPEVMRKVPPSYPEAARKASIEGVVMVQALVGRDGLIKDTRVVKSIPGLDEAAVEAVRQWEFKPAQAKGKPIAVWVAIPVSFKLH